MSDELNPNEGEENPVDDGTLLGGEGGEQTPDLSTLFTPEEIKAKQETATAVKAEEDRRAALTEEERAKEDAEKGDKDKWDAPAPDAYEWAVPEGMELDADLAEKFEPLAKKLNLSQPKAQELMDLYTKEVIPALAQRQQEQYAAMVKEWGDNVKADKEIGGSKFDENFQFAKKAMDQFATSELRKAMTDYGFGNHPEMVRLMVKVGKTMSEDTTIGGKANNTPNEGQPRTLNYDNTK